MTNKIKEQQKAVGIAADVTIDAASDITTDETAGLTIDAAAHIQRKAYRTTHISLCGEVPVIKYSIFEQLPDVAHGFSTRVGGVSEAPFDSMNLSFTRGDQADKVMENFRRFGQALGISCGQMVFSDQTHTTNLRIVTKNDCGKGILFDRDYHDIDGLITNEPNVALVTFFADCVPLYFVDPVKRVIAMSHSGWRGTVGKIGQKTVEKMQEAFGCEPEDIYAAIGPSICGECYEISRDVAEQFRAAFDANEYDQMMRDDHNGKYHLDLWKANELILKKAGISGDHLALPDICTCCNSDLMWSHRKTGGIRGSLAGMLMLRQS